MYSDLYDVLFGLTGVFMIFIVLLLLGVLAIRVLFLLNLHKTLEAVSPENRKMEPGLVWLALIPLFSWIWNFFIVTNIADSLKAEFALKDIAVQEDKPSYNVGLAYSILVACSIVPLLGVFASIGGFVMMIIYWVKTSEYKKTLLSNYPS